jgi:hypothetical protein
MSGRYTAALLRRNSGCSAFFAPTGSLFFPRRSLRATTVFHIFPPRRRNAAARLGFAPLEILAQGCG